MSGMRAQWVALLPGVVPELRLLSVQNFTCCPLVCGFPLDSPVSSNCPKHAGRQTGYAKLPLGTNECVNLCAWYTEMDWGPIRGAFPHLAPQCP